MPLVNPATLTDAQARSTVIKALRRARATYRSSDTAGEKLEREFDRLIKRKTRINANSLVTLSELYANLSRLTDAIGASLADVNAIASRF